MTESGVFVRERRWRSDPVHARADAGAVPLSPRQQLFIEEYLVDLNATQAAIRAGYSKRTAHSQGPRLLENVEIRRAIAKAQEERARNVRVEAHEVLRELKRIALVDIGEAFDAEGRLKPIHEMPPDVRRAIAGIEVEELFEGRGEERQQVGCVRKVKFIDKKGALELLGKHLKLWVDRVEHSGAVPIAVVDPYAERK